MTLNVVITKLGNAEKMRVTVMSHTVTAKMVLFVAKIIVPLAVKVISMKELIVAFQTRLQVSRSRFWILGLYGLESPYSSFLPTVPGLVLDGSH